MSANLQTSDPPAPYRAPQGLTLKQSRWVDFYLGEAAGNATEAARLAGYGANEATLRVIGCQNLTKYNVQQRIADRLAEQKVTSEEVRATLANQMRSDVTELFDDTGVLDLQTIREKRLGHLIKKIKRESRWEGKGDEKERVDTIELELHSAQTAATQLSKILGMEQEPSRDDEVIRAAVEIMAKAQQIDFLEAARRFLVTAEGTRAEPVLRGLLDAGDAETIDISPGWGCCGRPGADHTWSEGAVVCPVA